MFTSVSQLVTCFGAALGGNVRALMQTADVLLCAESFVDWLKEEGRQRERLACPYSWISWPIAHRVAMFAAW